MLCHACATVLEPHVFPGGHVRCPSCGADNVVDPPAREPEATPYRTASRLSEPEPEHHASGGKGLGPLCPRCTRLLQAKEGRELGCAACGGVFVDHGDLTARIDTERPSEPQPGAPRHARLVPREPDVRYARCPTCAQPMTRMNFGTRSGIILDVCRTHGTWFDRGELDAVLGFVREGGLEQQVTAPPAPADSGEAEAMLRVAQAELRAEWAQQQHAVEQVTDLLRYLFGPRYRSPRW